MRKNQLCCIGICFIVTIFCLMIPWPVYAAADTTAPTATNVSISTNSVTDTNGKFQVKLNVADSETGVKTVVLHFMAEIDHVFVDYESRKDVDQPMYSGHLTFEGSAKGWAAASYHLVHIEVADYAGNQRFYSCGEPDATDKLLSDSKGRYLPDRSDNRIKCYFLTDNTVTKTLEDVQDPAETPVLTGVHLPKQTTYEKGNTFYITADVKNLDKLKRISFSFWGLSNRGSLDGSAFSKDEVTYNNKEWEKLDSDTIKIPLIIYDYVPSDKYMLNSISLKSDKKTSTYFSGTNEADGDHMEYNNQKCPVEGGRFITVKSNGDEYAPVINKIEIKTPEVTKPGIARVQIEAFDDTGIKSATCYLKRIGDVSNYATSSIVNFDNRQQNRTILFEFPMGTAQTVGEYFVDVIFLEDFDKKEAEWNGNVADWNPKTQREEFIPSRDEQGRYTLSYMNGVDNSFKTVYFNQANRITVKEENDVAFEMGLSNPGLLSKVKTMKEKEAAKILVPNSMTIAKKELFEAIRGKDVTIIFFKDYFQWWFNGKDIKNPKDINLNIQTSFADGEDYNNNTDLPLFVFPENGELPGKAEVRIKSDYVYSVYRLTHVLYLYYMDQRRDELKLEDKTNPRYYLDGSDHWCRFTITHNSDYLTTGKKVKDTKVQVGDTFTKKVGNGKYVITSKNTVALVAPIKKNCKDLTIPDVVSYRGKTYKVTKIAKSACKGMKSLKSVTICKNIKTIGKQAFYGCKKLKQLYIESKHLSSKSVGAKAFKGTPKKMKVMVPKKKRKAYKKLLRKKGVSKKAKFPTRW